VEYYNAEVPYQYEGDDDYWVGNVELLGSEGSVLFASCNDGNVYMQTVRRPLVPFWLLNHRKY
jgi:hypothetical protein